LAKALAQPRAKLCILSTSKKSFAMFPSSFKNGIIIDQNNVIKREDGVK
jgi:hypothetical protein